MFVQQLSLTQDVVADRDHATRYATGARFSTASLPLFTCRRAPICYLFSDMLGRIEAQSELFGRLGNHSNSKEPSDEALSASLYADYAPLLLEDPSSLLSDPEKSEEQQQQRQQQTPPLICRTIRAFVCTKG